MLWFHLLAEGGTHPRGKSPQVVTGIGIGPAIAIWYHAVQHYLTAQADFADTRGATVLAAQDYDAAHGTTTAASVEQAWIAVGVDAPPPFTPTGTSYAVNVLEGEVAAYGPFHNTAHDRLRFRLLQGAGDGDLYVRYGNPARLDAYDCRSTSIASDEQCEIDATWGDYYLLVHAWTDGATGDVAGATLTIDGAGALPTWVPVTTWSVGALEGQDTFLGPYTNTSFGALRFELDGNGADGDLYVQLGAPPTGVTYDCASATSETRESCVFETALGGDYHVLVKAWSGDIVGGSVDVLGVAATTEIGCADGLDNDGDLLVDCADGDCAADAACAPPPSGCDSDGVCDPGEDCTTCGDCDGQAGGRPADRFCCGDGVQQGAETSALCDGNF